MAKKNRITQAKPRTGAMPSDQIVENQQSGQGGQQSREMMENDKLLYQLIEENVGFCGDQIGENLKFNSEVLTNTLYDNIYVLLGEKVGEDEFVQWVVDQLIEQGCITSNNEDSKPQTKPEPEVKETKPEPEVVTELDASAYDDLKQKVYASVDLIKANKLNVFKLLASLKEQVVQQLQDSNAPVIQVQGGGSDQESADTIMGLVGASIGNSQLAQKYLKGYVPFDDLKDQKEDILFSIADNVSKIIEYKEKVDKQSAMYQDSIKNTIEKLGASKDAQNKQDNGTKIMTFSKGPTIIKRGNITVGQFEDGRYGILSSDGKTWSTGYVSNSGDQYVYDKNGNAIRLGKDGKPIKPILGQKKPTLMQKIGTKIKNKIKGAWDGLKKKVSNSIVGKVWRGAKKVGKFAGKVAKGFIKASHFVGKAVVGGTIKGIRKLKKMGVKGVKNAIKNFAGAKIVTKLGIKAIKFVGKKIWSGIKKLGLKILGFLGPVFKVGKDFIGKAGYYAGKLGAAVKDKAYVFLVKPISTILSTAFSFALGMVMLPVQFMKQMLPAILDRVFDCLNGIKQVMKSLASSTLGIFKKILFNPLTIVLLIGGLFYFFGPKLYEMLTGGIADFGGTVMPKLIGFAKGILGFAQGVWSVISTVGSFLIDVIGWLTSPDSIIAGILRFVFTLYRWFKKTIKWMIGTTGSDSLKAACMFLSGDKIGLALHAIIGIVQKVWAWFKKTKTMRVIMNIINAITGFFKMFGEIWDNLCDAFDWKQIRYTVFTFRLLLLTV